MRSWGFNHEILSGKWVMSGLYISQMPRMLYGVTEYYLLMQMSLFQILILAAPQPSKLIDEMIRVFEVDNWLKVLHS